jgi:hypothetical protein
MRPIRQALLAAALSLLSAHVAAGCGPRKPAGDGDVGLRHASVNQCPNGQTCSVPCTPEGHCPVPCTSPDSSDCNGAQNLPPCMIEGSGVCQDDGTCKFQPKCESGQTCRNGSCQGGAGIIMHFANIDDDAEVWLRSNGSWTRGCVINSGNVPRHGDCNIGEHMASKHLTQARALVRIGNGGGFASKGDVWIDVNGARALETREIDNGWKHTGWTMRWYVDLDRVNGTATEWRYDSCVNVTDCMGLD